MSPGAPALSRRNRFCPDASSVPTVRLNSRVEALLQVLVIRELQSAKKCAPRAPARYCLPRFSRPSVSI